MVLWRKWLLSDLSHFKSSSLYKKKNDVYYFQISLSIPELLKKLMQISQVMMSYTQPTFDQIIMIKKDISANLYLKCLILCSKILLNHCVPQYKRNSFVTMATYYNWVPDFPILKPFLATFGISFRCLLMVPHLQEPANI